MRCWFCRSKWPGCSPADGQFWTMCNSCCWWGVYGEANEYQEQRRKKYR